MKQSWQGAADKRNLRILKWIWIWLLVGLGLSIPVFGYIAIWGEGTGGRWAWTAAVNAVTGVILFFAGGLLLDGAGVFDEGDKS